MPVVLLYQCLQEGAPAFDVLGGLEVSAREDHHQGCRPQQKGDELIVDIQKLWQRVLKVLPVL